MITNNTVQLQTILLSVKYFENANKNLMRKQCVKFSFSVFFLSLFLFFLNNKHHSNVCVSMCVCVSCFIFMSSFTAVKPCLSINKFVLQQLSSKSVGTMILTSLNSYISVLVYCCIFFKYHSTIIFNVCLQSLLSIVFFETSRLVLRNIYK